MRLPKWVRLPRRTVRVRLTALYSLLFLISGALLLAIASGVAVGSSAVAVSSPSVHGHLPGLPPGALGRADAQIRSLKAAIALLEAQQQNPQPNQSQLGHTLFFASLVALGIMTVVSAALGWLVAGRALRPVRHMTTAAQRISEDNLHERLAMTGPRDELKELGDTIDGLLGRLDHAFSAQRRFVANASHELRTPLTTMRAAVDVALAKPEPVPPQTVALAGRLKAELDRTDKLLEAFLVLARAQHRSLPGQAALPLDYIVGAALADQAAAIRAMDLTVQDTSGQGGAWVAGSQALLTRMVENVIDNAVCHNTEGGWVRITTEAINGRARIIVENGGEPLEPEQVAQLSQPFRRLGADRIGTDKGSGLGLSIVAAIAEAHGGTLDLQARSGGGLRVCVELPAAARTTPAVPAEARA